MAHVYGRLLFAMGQPLYRRCKSCGRDRSEVGPLSWTRQCGDCARDHLLENIEGMRTRSGPAFIRWRRGMVACALDPAIVAALEDAGVWTVLDGSRTSA